MTIRHWVRKSALAMALTALLLSVGCGNNSSTPQNPSPRSSQLVLPSGVVDFGSVPVGSSNSHSITITNQGTRSVTVSQINTSGSGFTMASQTLPVSLAAGQSLSVVIKFSPSSPGNASGQISLISDASNSPTSASLTGSGVSPAAPQLSATPGSLIFGSVVVGTTSSLSGTITASQGTVTISSATITGSGYSLRGLSFPLVLQASQSATFGVDFTPPTAVGLPGTIDFASNAVNSSLNISLSGTGSAPPPPGALCGRQDDGLIHLPPNYSCGLLPCSANPFSPPIKGGSFVDPQYGCSVRRLTDAVGDRLGTAAHHDYGTITPINADDTYVMINLENGSKEIVDVSGQLIVPASNMPGTNSPQAPWDISIPTRFYYTVGSAIRHADISGLPGCASTHNCGVSVTVLHDFAGTYASVQIPDEEDVSDDGDHFWLVGDTRAFLYTISTNTAGPAMPVGTKDNGGGWHKIQIMPSNRMLMTWGPNGPSPGAGQEVYNADTTLNWHMFDNTIHTDCGKDLNNNEVCVVARIPDAAGGINPANACPTWTGTQDGGIDIINMSSHAAQCLVDVNWADTEISFRDGGVAAGWVFITFFKSGTCNTYSCFDTTIPANLDVLWAAHWVHFAEEGLLVRIDNNNGPNKQRLFHTRSRSSEYYWAIPRGAISRDGKYVVFDSNFDISNSGLSSYTDVYISKVQ